MNVFSAREAGVDVQHLLKRLDRPESKQTLIKDSFLNSTTPACDELLNKTESKPVRNQPGYRHGNSPPTP